jgi:PAS domain S-box-containing protein
MLIMIILLFLSLIEFVVILFLMNRSHKNDLEVDNKWDELRSQLLSSQHELSRLSSLYEESEVLANIVRQSPNAIMLMNKNGDIQWTNRGFQEMYEYNFREFTSALGNNYRQTSFSPDVPIRLEFIERTNQPFRYEALNVTKTGKELWTQTALMPVLDKHGNMANMATIDTDIHIRVVKSDKLIAEMEQLNNKIDHLTIQFKRLETNFIHLIGSINEFFELMEQTDHILHFIKNISDETRILGFNASIEAGRAGV